MIGQGAPPSPCKQGLDSSSCPESKHKYLFLLGVHWQRRWNQDTTQTANKQPPRADGRQQRPRGPQGSCVDVVLSTFPSWRPSSPIYASSLPSSSPLFSFLFFSPLLCLARPSLSECPAHPATKSLHSLLRGGCQSRTVTQSPI